MDVTPVLILDDAFNGYAGRETELFVRPDDAHWNVQAHTLIAEFLLEQLKTRQVFARGVFN